MNNKEKRVTTQENQADFSKDLFDATHQAILDSIVDGVLIVDLDGEVLFINIKMRQLWNIQQTPTSQEVLSQVINKVAKPEQFLKRVKEIYADPSMESHDIIVRRDDKYYERFSKPLVQDETILGRVWTYRDITKRYKAEQALKRSEKEYRVLYAAEQRHVQELALLDRVRNSLAGVLDLPSLFREVVSGIADTFGYTLVSLYLIERENLNLQHQVGYDQVIQIIAKGDGVSWRTIQSREPVLIKDVQSDDDFLEAIEGIVSEICVPLFDEEKVVGTLNVESIDEVQLNEDDLKLMVALGEHVGRAIGRARLHTAVRSQEDRLRKIFDQAPIGMSINSLDGTFLEVNQAYEETVGYSEAELLGMKFRDLTHPEDIESNVAWLNRMIAGEISHYRFEKRYIRKDGAIVNVFLQVTLLFDADDKPLYLIGQVVDISDLKRAEEVLLQRQKSESLGILAGGIAHDFNNLLVALLAQSSLALAKLPAEDRARKHIEKAKLAAESAAQLTKQLLAYSGKGQFEMHHLDINKEIEQNRHLLQVAVSKQIQIDTQLASNLPDIIADQSQIQQILMNLIINGAEAHQDEPGVVKITTAPILMDEKVIESISFILPPPAPGHFVVVEVTDSGHGMDKETISKIFDPFFTTKFTGRGLGLAAVLGIVRSHNGGLTVESVPNKGTTFKFYFPVVIPQAPEYQSADSKPKEPESFARKRDATVLLIDDDAGVREAVKDIFDLHDIRVVCATNGTEGINLFQKHKNEIKIVLLDLSLPSMSSDEIFVQLRKIVPDIPIILCSGFSQFEINAIFADYEYNGFIPKPFEISDLIQAVQQYL